MSLLEMKNIKKINKEMEKFNGRSLKIAKIA